MSSFWALTALLVALALGFALWPLLRRESDPFARRAALLRDQLATLDAAQRSGVLDAGEAGSRREQLKAELLALLDAPAGGVAPKPPLVSVLVIAVLLPLLAVLLYQRFGTPNALAFAGVTRPASAAASTTAATAAPGATTGAAPAGQAPDLRGAAEGLQQRLADRPDDAEGWVLLGRTWQELGEFGKARDAFAKVYALQPEEPEILVDYAQALGLAAEPRSLLGEPRRLLEKALELQPDHARALWLYGYAQRQAGELQATLATWDKLVAQVPAGSPEAASLTRQINVVRVELGQPELPVPEVLGATAPPAAPATASAPAAAAPAPAPASAAAPGAGLQVRVELDPALADRIAPNDVLYVFARAESGPPMPLAISRVAASQLPFAVTLDDSMAMTPALKLSMFPQVIVGARVSKSGNATATAGDLQGFSAAIAQPHGGEVVVRIGEVVQ